MVICRYFLEGRCAYGDNCRFEHPADTGYAQEEEYYPEDYNAPRGHGSYRPRFSGYQPRHPSSQTRYSGGRESNWEPRGAPVLSPPVSFVPQSQFNQPTLHRDTDVEILTDIGEDIGNMWAQTQDPNLVFQRGRIWPFSVYTYCSPDGLIRTDPLFGLNDFSPEELRCAAYAIKHEPSALANHAKDVIALGNTVRQTFADISSACTGNPSSQAAKSVISEVRAKAAENEEKTKGSAYHASAQVNLPIGSGERMFTAAETPARNTSALTNGHPPPTPSATGVYSDTNMLSAEDFMQYASPEFTAGKVPYRPPPRSFC